MAQRPSIGTGAPTGEPVRKGGAEDGVQDPATPRNGGRPDAGAGALDEGRQISPETV